MAEEPVVQQAGASAGGGRGRQGDHATHREGPRHRPPDRGRSRGSAKARADNDYTSDFRRDYETRYGNRPGVPYETMAPAYDYGYRSASDPRYQGRSWSDVENDLRTDYERNYPNSAWEKTKDAVRYGWEKVTGKR